MRNIRKKSAAAGIFHIYYKNQNPSKMQIPDIFTIDLQNRRSYPYKRGALLVTVRPSFNDIKIRIFSTENPVKIISKQLSIAKTIHQNSVFNLKVHNNPQNTHW